MLGAFAGFTGTCNWHVAAMIEPASLVWRKTNAIRRKEGEKGYERKFALKIILKFYPKIEPLYQGILHQNILETRLTYPGKVPRKS